MARQGDDATLEAAARELVDEFGLSPARVLKVLGDLRQAFASIEDDGDPEVCSILLRQAVEVLGGEQALCLFEEEDVRALVRRAMATAYLLLERLDLGRTLPFSVDQLVDRTETAIRDLEANRDRLVRTGFGWECPRPDHHDLILMNLYPIGAPGHETLLTAGRTPRNGESVRLEGEQVDVAADPDAPVGGQATELEPEPVIRLDSSDLSRLGALRRSVLELRISTLQQLVRSLRNRDATELWSDFSKRLVAALTANELHFLYRMDARLRYAGAIVPGRAIRVRVPGRIGGVPIGGLLDFIVLVGQYEAMLTVGMMDELRPLLPSGLTSESMYPYFKVTGQPWRERLDAALDRFLELRVRESDFWHDWNSKLARTLEFELEESVTLEMRTRSVHAPHLEKFLVGVAEWAKSQLESTGVLPPLALSHATMHQATPSHVFKRQGQMWTLAYAGRTVHMKDAKGFRYIALLLRQPDRETSSVELVAAERGAATDSGGRRYCRMNAAQLGAQGLSVLDASRDEPVLDRQAMEEFRERHAYLKDKLLEAEENGDIERAAECREEIAALEDELKRSTGLGGRPRVASGPAERARKAVQQRIAESIKAIEREHPELGQHLRASIDTGLTCAYRPEAPVPWVL